MCCQFIYLSKNWLFIICLLLSSSLWAEEKVTVTVKANSHHEECFYLDTSSQVNYIFTADKALDFNFHYHDDNGMNYLKEIIQTNNEQNSMLDLFPKQVYCLMWHNRSNTPINMNYQFSTE